MNPEPAASTLEATLRDPVFLAPELTLGAFLRGVPGIHVNNLDTSHLCFVLYKGLKLVKAPTVELPVEPLAFGVTGSDLFQVFKYQGRTLLTRLDQLLTQDTVTVTPETFLSTRELLKMSLGRFCAFGLKGTPQFEVSPFYVLPAPLTQKLVLGSYGWMRDTKIDSDCSLNGYERFLFTADYDMKEVVTLPIPDKIGRADFPVNVWKLKVRDFELDSLSAGYGC